MEDNCYNYNTEKDLEDHLKGISLEQMEYFQKQMKNSICKIKCKEGHGTGFLWLIPNPSKLKQLRVLITNNHVLNEKDIEDKQIIEITINNDSIKKEIVIDNLRKTYTNKDYDTTFIEVKESDNFNINSFLEIDYEIYEEIPKEKYIQKSIYLLHYPNSEKVKYS